MAKENYIKFRCSDDFKRLVEYQAKQHGRSVSSYIEYLIRKDVDTMRVIYNFSITDEMEEVFKKEETIYLSSDGEKWLFTDMSVFDEMDKKFQFDVDTEKKQHAYWVDMEGYINNQYEEENLTYFGLRINMTDYDELVLELIDNNQYKLCCEGWDKVIDEWLRACTMEGIRMGVEDIVCQMIDDGWNISELKDAVSNALYMKGIK